ncbi:MAG: SNF2 family DNA or RNA helicase [Bacillariaceae sp.]
MYSFFVLRLTSFILLFLFPRQKGANPDAKNKSEVIGVHLRDMLNKMMIVRTKQEVFPGDQIPQKTERVIFCDLSPLQKEVYMHVLELPEFDLVKHGSRPCDCGINQDFFRQFRKLSCKAEQLEYYRRNKSLIKNQSQCCKGLPINPRYGLEGGEGEPYIDQDATIWRSLKAHSGDDAAATEGCENCPYCCTFPCLQKLKSLSSHLGLIQAPRQTTEAQVKGSPAYINYIKAREFAKVSLSSVASRLPGRGYERSESIMDDHFSLSGKLRVLARLLEKYYNESAKVLLFAHSTQTLDLIENWLRSRQSFVHLRMDGSTPTRLRQGIADDFNGDPHIFLFLLSTKAMGQGLTLNVSFSVSFQFWSEFEERMFSF